jgi:hypothetical protein
MSWAPMVKVVNDPKWYTNALRYATREEAEADAYNLSQRWTAVVSHGIEERDDPVNRRWEPGLGSVMVMDGEGRPDADQAHS